MNPLMSSKNHWPEKPRVYLVNVLNGTQRSPWAGEAAVMMVDRGVQFHTENYGRDATVERLKQHVARLEKQE